jgi:hypothetical protein
MMTTPICHCLNDHWSVVFQCSGPGSCGGIVHSEEVISVHADGGQSICNAACCNAIAFILLSNRRTNRVPIVATEEDDRTFQRGSHIQCNVEVTLTGSSLTEVTHHHVRTAGTLERISASSSLWQLRAERTGDGLEVESSGAIVHWHLAALARIVRIAKALMSEILQCETAPHQHSGFSVLTVHNVVWFQSRCAADVRGLLAVGGHVEGNAALPLRVVKNFIHLMQLHHRSVHASHGLWRVFQLIVWLSEIRFLIHHTEAYHWSSRLLQTQL